MFYLYNIKLIYQSIIVYLKYMLYYLDHCNIIINIIRPTTK